MKAFIKKSILIFCICALFASVAAASTGPDCVFVCAVNRGALPDGAKYLDMLIPISENDEDYADFNTENGERFKFSRESEIAQYNSNGFMSLTLHYNDVASHILLYEESPVEGMLYVMYEILMDGKVNEYYGFNAFREKYKCAKFAYLDEAGEILAVTNEIDIWEEASGRCQISIGISGAEADCTIIDFEKRERVPVAIVTVIVAMLILNVIIISLAIISSPIWVTVFVLKRRKKSKRQNGISEGKGN